MSRDDQDFFGCACLRLSLSNKRIIRWKLMKIVILATGANPVEYLNQGESVYLKRLKHYAPVEIREIQKVRNARRLNENELKKQEAEGLLKLVPPGYQIIALDPSGSEYTTEKLADRFQKWRNRSVSGIAFIIGGPFGLDNTIKRQADMVLSLSRLTFPHDMVRLILLEQLYRVMTLLNHEKYHK